MMPASHNTSGGIINAPDPCLATWVNFANMTDAAPFSPNVFWTAGNAIFQASILLMSHGDEPDTPVFAPTIGPAFFPMGIPKILINGIPAIALMCPSISNAGNATKGAVMIPSAVNVFMMFAASGTGAAPSVAEGPAAITREELEQLAGSLETPSGPGCGVLLSGGVGYLRIDTFTSAVPSMVYGAVRDLQAQGLTSLVIDLRDNRGGEVTAALELAGDFLPTGTLLCTLRDADGDDTDYRARAGTPWRVPLVLLVNRATASAAELFAGCLQAHGRALVAGERTYGKGVVQAVASRAEDGSLDRLSVADCRLPNGALIQGTGIEPDVALARPEPFVTAGAAATSAEGP